MTKEKRNTGSSKIKYNKHTHRKIDNDINVCFKSGAVVFLLRVDTFKVGGSYKAFQLLTSLLKY